jgi:hypothetical protein
MQAGKVRIELDNINNNNNNLGTIAIDGLQGKKE